MMKPSDIDETPCDFFHMFLASVESRNNLGADDNTLEIVFLNEGGRDESISSATSVD